LEVQLHWRSKRRLVLGGRWVSLEVQRGGGGGGDRGIGKQRINVGRQVKHAVVLPLGSQAQASATSTIPPLSAWPCVTSEQGREKGGADARWSGTWLLGAVVGVSVPMT
jgi:hypothetical protein